VRKPPGPVRSRSYEPTSQLGARCVERRV